MHTDINFPTTVNSPEFVLNFPVPQREERLALTKVLHVINGEHFSGAERVQQLLGKRSAQFGFDAIFACVKPGKFLQSCKLRKRQLSEFPMQGRYDISIVRQMEEKVRAEDISLLHAHTPRTALITSLLARRTDLPWIYHVHSPTIRDSARPVTNRVNMLMERIAIRTCSKVITVSKSLRREMLRLGVQRNRLHVVANGVPAIEPIDTDERLQNETWTLGMLALFRPRKGVEVAIEAMRLLAERKLPVKLQLIGGFESPEYQDAILDSITLSGLESEVTWKGFTEDVAGAVRELDGLVLPSLFGEGMPMVVLEALAAAVPVVATKVEGTPEVIRHGIEGYLAAPTDPIDLAKCIEQLVTDRRKWASLSENALVRHRQQFSDDKMAEAVAKVYQKALS